MSKNIRSLGARTIAVVASLVVVALGLPGTATAAPGPLTITPIGWNVVGLRSNDVTTGPNQYMVGAKVCNTGSNPVTNITASWAWDQPNAYVNLAGTSTRLISSLAAAGSAGDCGDAWFLITVTRDAAAFDTSRDFHVTASAAGQTSVSTPAGREIYVQKLIRQNRNTVSSIVGPSTVYVGNSYTYTINASTSTAYEQLATTGVFASPIFEVRSVSMTYDNPGGSASQFYVDACGFQPDPAIVATYLSCVGPANVAGGKAGGNLVITVVVDAVGTGTTNVSGVIYDLSGGSYHYNQDFGTGTNSLTITSSYPDTAPSAVNDTATTNEDTSVDVDVLANDSDLNGNMNAASLSVQTQPTNGTASIVGGKVHYVPTANFNGTDTLTYKICDSTSPTPLCSTATVTITVNPVNDAPDAVNDSKSTNEDTALTFDPRTNDTDPENDTLTVTGTGSASHGTVSFTGTSVTYTPAANYNGPDSFTYTISDGNGGTDTATVNVTVNSVNDAPDAVNDSKSTNEDTALTFDPRTNDTDPENDTPTVTGTGSASHGTVGFTGTSVTYTPAANYNGPDSFTYTISDGNGGTDTATVNVTVNPVNDAPDAVNDSVTTNEDTAVTTTVLSNDTDVEGDTLSVTSVTQGSHGSVVIVGNQVKYTPAANWFGSDSYTYTISDGNGGTDTATVNVTVSSVNDAPDAVNDSATTNEDTAVTTSVLSNDTDVEGDTLSVTSVTQGSHGSVVIVGNQVKYTPDANWFGLDSYTYTISDGNGGTDTATVNVTVSSVNDAPDAVNDSKSTNEDTALTFDPRTNDTDPENDTLTVTGTGSASHGTVGFTGTSVTYTPAANYNGPDSFTYTISDGNGGTDTATVNVTVNSVNDAPQAVADVYNVNQDTATVLAVLANDTDADGDVLTPTVLVGPTHGTFVTNLDGTVTYTPNVGYLGPDSFTYKACDPSNACSSTTVSLTVLDLPEAPLATDDVAGVTEDGSVGIDVLANDTDPDSNLDPTTVTITAPASHGSTSVDPLTGEVTYTPDPNYHGPDSFGYQVCDLGLPVQCDTATVSVTVSSVNDAPDAVNDSATTNEDTAVTTTVLSNDTDVEGDTLSVTSVTQGSHGSVVIVGNQVKYTPDANWFGLDSYTYTISDGNGGTDTATVNVTVDPVNDAPYAGDGAVTTNEDTNVIVDVAALTSDIDSGPLVITVTGGPTHGALVDNGDGTYTYQPDPDYFGPDTFTYQVCDADLACATGTIDITVTPVNDPPVAAGDSVSLFQDTPTVIDVLGNDSDADGDPLATNVLSAPLHGSVVLNPDGTVTYTPDPGYIGPDSFSYEACDPASACDSATVTISVVDLPEPPVAKDDSATVSEDGSVGIDVLANDTDPENNIDPTAVTVTAGPAHGSTSVDPVTGVVTYTPDANFNGSDQFTYQVCDSGAPVQCDTADVLVTVDPVNDPPTAVDDSVTLNEDTSGTTVDVRGNDSDPESASSSLSVSLDVGPSHGSVVDNGDGTFTYTPDADYSGPDSFTYLVCDPSLACDVATVDVTVDPVNDPPVAVGDTVATNENTDVTVTVLGNDSDVDSVLTTAAGATVSVTGAPAHGSTTVNANGTVTYSPDPGYSGPDSFTYQVCDSAGGCDSAVVAVTVNGVNSNPVANDDAGATNEDTNVTVDVLTNDVDPEGQPLAVTSATNGGNGSTTVNADGTITYSPDAGWFGVDTFTYTISDGNGGSATATVTITVNSVNDSPVAKDDSVVTDEDTPVTTVDVTGNDTDPDGDPLTVTGHSPAAHGTVTDNGDGTFDYAPDADYFGPDAFTYTVSDGNGGTDTATVNVTVKPVNDAPLAQDDSATTNESQPVTVVVLGNDSDVDSPLTSAGGAAVTVTSGPGNGSVAVNGSLSVTYTPNPGFFGSDSFTYQVCDADGACDTATVDVTVVDNLAPLAVDDAASTNEDVPVTVDVVTNDSDPEGGALTVVSSTSPGHGVLVDNGDGTFTYTPAANWSGTDTFTYTVSDDLGNTATATVTVTVSAVNDAPKARHDSDSTLEDTPVDVTVLTNDTDPEGDTLTVVSAGSGSHGSTTVNGNGTVTYVPDSGWSGTDTFSYTIRDGNGGTDTATVTVTVDAVNAAPSAVDDSAKTAEDHAVTIAVKANDSDPDGDPTTVTGVTQPSHGTTKVKGGQVVYTPDHNYNGVDSFTYTLCDPFGACDVATVTVTVAPRNDAPVAKDDAIDAQAGQPVTIHVGANDHDVEGQPVTVTVVEQPSDGSAVVKPNGDIVFTADAGANGVQTFVYEICDPDGDCSQATVSVTVAGASVPAPAPVPSTPPQGGPLPHTGAEVTRLALWAASMLAMGAALLLGSAPLRLRRRD